MVFREKRLFFQCKFNTHNLLETEKLSYIHMCRPVIIVSKLTKSHSLFFLSYNLEENATVIDGQSASDLFLSRWDKNETSF